MKKTLSVVCVWITVFLAFCFLFSIKAQISFADDACSGHLQSNNHSKIYTGTCYYWHQPNSPQWTTDSGQAFGCVPWFESCILPSCATMKGAGSLDLNDNSNACPPTILPVLYKCCSDQNPQEVLPINPCPDQNGLCTSIPTAIGTIDVQSPAGFIENVFAILLSLSGGIAVILIIFSGYRILASSGDPEKVKGAREMLTSAIVGLLFIIFSVVILQIISIDILHIPGFVR